MRKRFDITDQQLKQMLSKSRKIVNEAKNLLLDYEMEIVERLEKRLGKSVDLVASLNTDRPQHGFPSLLILLSDSQQWHELFMTDEEKRRRAIENSKQIRFNAESTAKKR